MDPEAADVPNPAEKSPSGSDTSDNKEDVTPRKQLLEPPPVRLAARFKSPIQEEIKADMVSRSKIILQRISKPPPPDDIDVVLKRKVDSLSLLVRSTYSADSFTRHCPEMLLPREMLKNVDISWTVFTDLTKLNYDPVRQQIWKERQQLREAFEGTDELMALELLPLDAPDEHGFLRHGSHGIHGKKTLETAMDHREDHIVLNSPRSVYILIKNGLTAESLRPGEDALAETRHRKLMKNMQREYHDFTQKVSCKKFVEMIRTYDPKHEEKVMKKKEPPQRNLSPTRAKPRNLDRLQRHRENFTAEWGQRQQTLANQSYVNSRVVKQVEDALSTKREHARALSPALLKRPNSRASSGSPQRREPPLALPSPLKGAAAHKGSVTTPPKAIEDSTSPDKKGADGRPPPVTTNALATQMSMQSSFSLPRSPSVSGSPLLGRRSISRGSDTVPLSASESGVNIHRGSATFTRIQHVRDHHKQLQKNKMRSLEDSIAAKDAAAERANSEKRKKLEQRVRKHQDRAKEVKAVNERMRRTEEFRRLQLIKQHEDTARANHARAFKWDEKVRERRVQQKIRTELEHRTLEFMDRGSSQVNKKIFLQEMSAAGELSHKVTKDESQQQLLRLLREEDELITEWKRLEVRAGHYNPIAMDFDLIEDKDERPRSATNSATNRSMSRRSLTSLRSRPPSTS